MIPKEVKNDDVHLLSIFRGSPDSEGLHVLTNESSTWSSSSRITKRLVPAILDHKHTPNSSKLSFLREKKHM